jgi:protein SCO1
VQIIYVTVDHERDTAQRLKQYLGTFDPSFIGATDTPQRLSEVRRQYGVMAERKDLDSTYVVAHSSSTYLIDRRGRLRALMPYGRSPDDYVHDLAILLQEPSSATASDGE